MKIFRYSEFIKEDLKDKLAQNTNSEKPNSELVNLVSKIDSIKKEIENKKLDMNKKLENLEKLNIDSFTEENQKYAEQKKVEMQKGIELLKIQIDNLTKSIAQFSKNIEDLKTK